MSTPAVAFLSNRKLHVRKNGATQVIESEFERSVHERTASIERRHAWKSQGRGAMFMGGASMSGPSLNSAQNGMPAVLLTGLTTGPDGGILYSMETDAVSGVFVLDAMGVETRLFHTADFCIRNTALHPGGAMLAATAFHRDTMRSNIAVLPVQGTDFSEVTEGDSFDQVPHWVPGAKKRIVFQSAGIGRNAAGHFAGLGPCTIQQLDLDSGELEEVASESGRDLLQPRAAADGTLYYIRKPYESGVPQVSLLNSMQDAALFPFRLARAVFQYFNVFSMMYTGKPLVTGKGAVQRRLDPRMLFIHGNLARAQMIQNQPQDDAPGLVPPSWELVRRQPGGRTETIAKSVLTFDLAADGGVVHSDGTTITLTGADGSSELVLQGELIEQVLAL